jgi:large subunit ribosomal protein L10
VKEMSVARARKETIVTTLVKELGEASSVVFADFTGVNVEEITELRREFREAGVAFTIVKNTLLKRVFSESDISEDESVYSLMQGPTALAYAGDEVLPVKVMKQFAGNHDGRPSIKGGFVAGTSYNREQMLDLASLPGRDVLLARVLGSMNSPLQGFVSVSGGIIRKLMYAINSLAEKTRE